MKHTSPTLLTLAALVIAPAAYALDVKDDDVKLGLSLQLQVRAEVAKAQDNNGDAYNVADGTTTQPDAVDFYMRSVRFGFKGSYKDDMKFGFVVRADGEDKTSSSTKTSTDTSNGRTPEVQQAYIGREFKQGNLTHYVQAGLDYAFFNGASGVVSSNTLLFVDARATEQTALLAPRGVGLKYQLKAPYVTWGVDIQNNVTDTANGPSTGNGLCYTTRVQITPENEWKLATASESYLGKEGKGVLLSLEYGKNVDAVDSASPTEDTTDLSAFGSEVYFHYNQVSALAEIREAKSTVNDDASTKARVWLVQAGYAMPCPLVKGAIMEPALRYTKIDLNKDNDAETAAYGSAEYGKSGTQFDVGVNYYLNGANTKFALDYANWKAEEGDAKAQIVRLQAQLYF